MNYKCKDFYLSAILYASGLPLLRIESNQTDKHKTFVFQDDSQLAKTTINSHWSGELQISSKLLISSINELKTRLYQEPYAT